MAHQSRHPMGVVHVPTANDVHSPVPINDDVVREILHALDIVALSHYGLFLKAHPATALRLLKERVKCYTLPFFPDERAWTTFFEALESSRAGLTALSRSRRSHCKVGPRLLGRKNYHVHQLQQHTNIRVVLARTHTGQLNTISARELICFNVHPTAEQTVVEGWRHPGENVRTPFLDAVTHERNTAEWSEPCGIYCPAQWRTTHSLRGVGHWKWGGVNVNDYREMDPSLRRMGEQRILWRTGLRCLNRYCEHGKKGWTERDD
ncbi:hypothetical protein C8J57DRAFT_1256522 [Mycena rebaudengoi]|nr:hypothetical protein C8J57DRAFT_1256522 [Mycena rebaudengoi]